MFFCTSTRFVLVFDEVLLPNNNYLMDGNLIMVRTLDLNLEFDLIAKRLNKITIDYFNIK